MKEVIFTSKFDETDVRFFQNKDSEDERVFLNRRDMGEALGYKYPMRSIAKLHYRYKPHFVGRVEKDTAMINDVEQDMIFYTVRGVKELCKISSQYNALDFYSWVKKEVNDNAEVFSDRQPG